MNSSALESRDHSLEITILAESKIILDIGDRALAYRLLQITVIVLQA